MCVHARSFLVISSQRLFSRDQNIKTVTGIRHTIITKLSYLQNRVDILYYTPDAAHTITEGWLLCLHPYNTCTHARKRLRDRTGHDIKISCMSIIFEYMYAYA